ncbi:putative secreted protein [Mucilaginibacter frigoritolerans]|jgi:predicted secreted protein|uniref:Putative secreted protein n=1 Tax=Mucilaginibacter frigoritolerans TaxID=652788 RepID=A0A562U6M7_9SPHI|nr:protease inhibitor I42 family protein [Mucilaginibacter frigoritolerans]TWJ01436.1 putative secreted protein [Mucilaginibacter frigoritolerans]
MDGIQLNVFYKVLFVFFTVAFMLIFCGQKPISEQKRQATSITEKDSGKTLRLLTGQQFTLTLPDRIDGGYRFNKIQFDTTILKVDKHVEHLPAAGEALGKPGQAIWWFIGLKKGKTIVKITISRPWKKADSITVFSDTVMVR